MVSEPKENHHSLVLTIRASGRGRMSEQRLTCDRAVLKVQECDICFLTRSSQVEGAKDTLLDDWEKFALHGSWKASDFVVRFLVENTLQDTKRKGLGGACCRTRMLLACRVTLNRREWRLQGGVFLAPSTAK